MQSGAAWQRGWMLNFKIVFLLISQWSGGSNSLWYRNWFFFVLRNYLWKLYLVHSSRIEIRILHYLLLCRLLGFKFWRCHFRLSLVKPTLLFCESRYTLIQMCTYNLWNNIEESADKTVRNFQGCTLLFTYVLFSVTMDIFILDS